MVNFTLKSGEVKKNHALGLSNNSSSALFYLEENVNRVENIIMINENEKSDLLSSAEAKKFLGFRCKTNHPLRALERKGLLTPVRLNSRALRYRWSDLLKLVEVSQ